MKLKQHFLGWLLCVSLLIPMAHAEVSTGWVTNPDHPPVKIQVSITGVTEADTQTVNGILEVLLEDDWKTYWRSPGEGGIPPTATWDSAENITDVSWQWPTPDRYTVSGIETVGYTGDTLFPMQIKIADWNQPAVLAGTITMSSCTNICVLTDFPIELYFNPVQLAPDTQRVYEYQRAISQVPRTDIEAVVVEQSVWSQSTQQLRVALQRDAGWKQPDVFLDSAAEDLIDITVNRPHLQIDGQLLTATFGVSHWLGTPAMHEHPLQLTVVDDSVAAELQVQAKLGEVDPITGNSPEGAGLSWWVVIISALLGGLILNIMPCVLPVLGMKLQSVLTASKQQPVIRRQFLASAAGIIFSFWLLAGFLLLLKYSGQALGWGVQFQNPYFIGFMILVTWLFTLNLAGLFEVRLPGGLSTWAASKGDHSYRGHFVQGMFATLLATPCSAPFLGTAVSFALGASALQLIAIFTFLGIGMALPWLAVASWPKLALRLPKPGRWMGVTKIIFSLMLAATTVWLLTLLRSHVELSNWWWLVLAWAVITLFSVMRVYGRRGVLIAIASSLLLIAVGAVTASLTSGKWAEGLRADHPWVPLDTTEIAKAVRNGQIVFVDVTADWCITCKANKIGVLLQDPVYSALQQEQVITMRGDWTQPSDQVTDYLRKYNRYGVPFNIVYGPGAPEGIELPVVLTDNRVLEAIKGAQP